MDSMIIRAGIEHLRMIAEAGKEAVKDMPLYKNVPFDINHSISIVQQFINLPQMAMFIKQVDGQVVGLFMGVVGAHWFTPMKEMTELMFWVHKDYRNTSLARDLLKTAESWAKEEGAKKITIASGTGYETERVMKFYSRLGYTRCSLAASKEI